MPTHRSSQPLIALTLMALAGAGTLPAEPAGQAPWARVTEDDATIKIETGQLEAVIPKKNPKQWMTGIEKGSFLDKSTGFREAGDGLCIVDWIMEPGSDEAWQEQGTETVPYRFNNDYHGKRAKRIIEGPQLCHRMKPVQPQVIRGKDFVAVKTTYRYEYAAPGYNAGSKWTQLLVFPKGKRYFFSMDRIDSVDEMHAVNDRYQGHRALSADGSGWRLEKQTP